MKATIFRTIEFNECAKGYQGDKRKTGVKITVSYLAIGYGVEYNRVFWFPRGTSYVAASKSCPNHIEVNDDTEKGIK